MYDHGTKPPEYALQTDYGQIELFNLLKMICTSLRRNLITLKNRLVGGNVPKS